MNTMTAVFLFLAVCVVLAILLLSGVITPLAGGLIFAVALVTFGVISRGFTRTRSKQNASQSAPDSRSERM